MGVDFTHGVKIPLIGKLEAGGRMNLPVARPAFSRKGSLPTLVVSIPEDTRTFFKLVVVELGLDSNAFAGIIRQICDSAAGDDRSIEECLSEMPYLTDRSLPTMNLDSSQMAKLKAGIYTFGMRLYAHLVELGLLVCEKSHTSRPSMPYFFDYVYGDDLIFKALPH